MNVGREHRDSSPPALSPQTPSRAPLWLIAAGAIAAMFVAILATIAMTEADHDRTAKSPTPSPSVTDDSIELDISSAPSSEPSSVRPASPRHVEEDATPSAR
jgi:hypothetical protein